MPTALVTGASSGIGKELARILAREGHDVVLVGRDKARLAQLKLEIEHKHMRKTVVIAADLSDPAVPEKLHAALKGAQVDILVNNAGVGDYGRFAQSDWKRQEQMLRVNVDALTRLTHLVLPGMLERRKGRILNVASTAAFQPGPLMAVYYASKAYVLSFSQAIAQETEGSGVTVTALCPGPTATGFQDAANLSRSRLFSGIAPATARDVAQYGYDAMLRGKRVAVYGARNKSLVFLTRLMPREALTRIVARLQRPR